MPKFTLRLKPIMLEVTADTRDGALTEFADVLMDRAYWLKSADFVYIKEEAKVESCEACYGIGNTFNGVSNIKCTVCGGTGRKKC